MLIFAQPQKIIGADFPGQSKPFRTRPNPFAGHALSFIVVIANAEVFLEVFPRVLEVVLRLCRDHAPDTTRTVRACCVCLIHRSLSRIVMNCLHEQRTRSTLNPGNQLWGIYHTDREYCPRDG